MNKEENVSSGRKLSGWSSSGMKPEGLLRLAPRIIGPAPFCVCLPFFNLHY